MEISLCTGVRSRFGYTQFESGWASSVTRRKERKLFEKIAAGAGLFFYSGGMATIFHTFAIPSLLLTFIRYGILLIPLVVLPQQPNSTLRAVLRGKWAWALIGLAVVSWFWSEIPGITLRNIRSEIIPMTVFSLYFATRFDSEEQFQVIAWVLGVACILSFVFAIGIPSIGRHHEGMHAGSWRGIFGHKNLLGLHAVLATSVFLLIAIHARRRKLLAWACVASWFFLIIASGSRNAIVLCSLIIPLLLIYRIIRFRGMNTIVLVLLALGGIGAIVFTLWEPLLTLLGRETTLSSRTLIWTFLLDEAIPNRFILGYGSGNVFWLSGPLFADMWEIMGHIPRHAHNGFLDLILQLGLVGLVLFVLSFVQAYASALKRGYQSRDAQSLWPLAFLSALFLSNVGESQLLLNETLVWCLYLVICSSPKEG